MTSMTRVSKSAGKKRANNRRKPNAIAPTRARFKTAGSWLLIATSACLFGVAAAFLGNHFYEGFKTVANRPVAAIEIDSELKRVSMQELQAVLSPLVSKPFLSIDLNRVKTQLEAHPWIASVSLNRQWPDKLSVHFVEETAIARWQQTAFLNQAGEKIELNNNQELSNLPQLIGPEKSEKLVARKFVEINELLKPLSLAVSKLTLTQDLAWQVELNNNLQLKLGRDQVAEKVERFASVYRGALEDRLPEIQLVDLRYRNGLAVQWQSQALTTATN